MGIYLKGNGMHDKSTCAISQSLKDGYQSLGLNPFTGNFTNRDVFESKYN